MVRLHLFVEGQTEQTYADTVLKRHLANYGVYMQKPVLIAHARKKGKVHRGGGRKFAAMQRDIDRRLKQESSSDVFFTTMIDLYALHKDFPGREEAESRHSDPYKRVMALEKSWFDETRDIRFIPFIQLHEFEAYLFVDVSKFALFFDHANSGIFALRRVAGRVSSPEQIDDGQHTAPSKRIIEEFPEYEDLKPTVGPDVAELIGFDTIRTKCPHLDGWIKRLEELGAS